MKNNLKYKSIYHAYLSYFHTTYVVNNFYYVTGYILMNVKLLTLNICLLKRRPVFCNIHKADDILFSNKFF